MGEPADQRNRSRRMNDAILTQLKFLVERVVRPVRASISCKRKMREELLGHVTSVFAEELANLGNEDAALERTKERFGKPAEVTNQLEKALLKGEDRIWVWETWTFQPGKSPFYFAMRNLLLFLPIPLLMLLTFVPTLLSLYFFGALEWSPADDVISLLGIMGAVNAIYFASVFCCTLLVCEMRQALFGPNGPSWTKAILIAALSTLMVPSSVFMCGLIDSGDVWSSGRDTFLFFPLFVIVPFLVAVLTFIDIRWRRFDQDWANIKID
jgi:hypothetical protein